MNQENETPTEIETTEIIALDLTFKPEIFDPNKEQLHAIAAEVAKIQANPELMTKEDLELINSTKNKLVKARTRIQKIGKAQREPATAYAKEVKAYEDSLLEILAPQEARMKELESAAKTHAMNEERMKTLPEYIEKLLSIGDDIHAETSFLLSLDPNQRDQYYNERLAAKNQADRAAIEEEKQRQAAEAERLENEKKLAAERIYNHRVQTLLSLGFQEAGNFFTYQCDIAVSKDNLHNDNEETFSKLIEITKQEVNTCNIKLAEEAEAKRQQEIKEAEERAKEQAEKEAAQRAADEEAKRQADAKAAEEEAARLAEQAQKEEAARQSSEAYQKWLSDSSYNEQTDIIQENAGVYTLYRKVSSYQPEAFGFKPNV